MTLTRESPPDTGWRRHRATLLIVGGFLLAVTVVVLGAGGARTTAAYDPDNPDPGGARALAKVLDDHGVDVRVVRGAAALEADPIDPAGTVLVSQPDLLGDSTATRLRTHVGGARLVVAGPNPGALDSLGLTVGGQPVDASTEIPASCTDPDLATTFDGLELSVDAAAAFTGAGCFPGTEPTEHVLTTRDGVVLFGAPDAFTNDQVLRSDNAAVALRLLGSTEQLTWYVPDVTDLGGEDGVSLGTLIPRWVGPGIGVLVLASLALMLWRGRRLGPLAIEPMPVVVRAIETTRSRGRLYRRAGDRQHAARALQSATRHRLGVRLRLGAPTPDDLVRAVAHHTGRDVATLHALLGSSEDHSSPGTDDALITLAVDLAALEEEVRRT